MQLPAVITLALAAHMSLAVNFNGTTTESRQKGYAFSDTDCSQCTGSGPCAPCESCVDSKSGPCAPCWSDDNSAGTACLPACSSCYGSSSKSYVNGRTPTKKPDVKASTCEAITDEKTCMTSSEGSEACAWCSSGAVGTSCQKESDAQQLPAAVFECEYQTGYAAYTTSNDNADNTNYVNGRDNSAFSTNTPQLSSSSECNTYNYLKKAGFPQSSLATMVCISKYESSWNCKATNKNVDGSTDYGLMQINSYYWCSGDPTSKYNECGTSCSSLFDCQKNANCAYVVYRQQGYNAWYGYKNHKSECDNYKVKC